MIINRYTVCKADNFCLTHQLEKEKSKRNKMDGLQIVATSIGVIGFVLLIVLFACRILGPKTTAWVCSNREEKIGFSKSKLYNANGYLVSVY